MSRSVTTVLGVLLGVVGLVAVAVPGIATALPAGETLVLVVGAVLVLGAVHQVRRRRGTDMEYAETPDAERAVDLPTPGDDLDRRLDGVSLTRFDEAERTRIRDEIGEVAVATIQRRDGCSREDAERALEAGTWTDDPFAAAFFTGEPPPASRRARAREMLNTDSAFERRAAHAIEAVDRLLEDEDA